MFLRSSSSPKAPPDPPTGSPRASPSYAALWGGSWGVRARLDCKNTSERGSLERDILSLRALGPGGGQISRVVHVSTRAAFGVFAEKSEFIPSVHVQNTNLFLEFLFYMYIPARADRSEGCFDVCWTLFEDFGLS